MEVLNIARYTDKEKKRRQLEKLNEFIDFEILENGKIKIISIKQNEEEIREKSTSIENDGNENDKFKTVKDFYNDNRGERAKVEFRDIIRTSLMGVIKENLIDRNNYIFRIGYEELALKLGFFNEIYRIVRRSPIRSTQIINGVGGRPKGVMGRQTVRAIDNIGGSYLGYINRGLETLKKEGYIDYQNGYWGYREEGFNGSSVLMPLSHQEECFFLGEARDIIYKEMKVEDYRKIKYLNKENEFYSRLNLLMRERYGLSYISRQIEISLGNKSNNKIMKKVRWGEQEEKWINKHFFETLRDNGEKYYKSHIDEKNDEGNYKLLLEILVKREKVGDRGELKDIRKALRENIEK